MIVLFHEHVYDSVEKLNLSAIPLVIEQRKNEFGRIAKIRCFPFYCYALREIYYFPETCQDLFLS